MRAAFPLGLETPAVYYADKVSLPATARGCATGIYVTHTLLEQLERVLPQDALAFALAHEVAHSASRGSSDLRSELAADHLAVFVMEAAGFSARRLVNPDVARALERILPPHTGAIRRAALEQRLAELDFHELVYQGGMALASGGLLVESRALLDWVDTETKRSIPEIRIARALVRMELGAELRPECEPIYPTHTALFRPVRPISMKGLGPAAARQSLLEARDLLPPLIATSSASRAEIPISVLASSALGCVHYYLGEPELARRYFAVAEQVASLHPEARAAVARARGLLDAGPRETGAEETRRRCQARASCRLDLARLAPPPWPIGTACPAGWREIRAGATGLDVRACAPQDDSLRAWLRIQIPEHAGVSIYLSRNLPQEEHVECWACTCRDLRAVARTSDGSFRHQAQCRELGSLVILGAGRDDEIVRSMAVIVGE